MSIGQVTGAVGTLVGLGFGIYASSQNFDPDGHQAATMSESTRVFSELLTQIGMVSIQAGALGLLTGAGGLLLDLITCCALVSKKAVVSEEQRPLTGISIS